MGPKCLSPTCIVTPGPKLSPYRGKFNWQKCRQGRRCWIFLIIFVVATRFKCWITFNFLHTFYCEKTFEKLRKSTLLLDRHAWFPKAHVFFLGFEHFCCQSAVLTKSPFLTTQNDHFTFHMWPVAKLFGFFARKWCEILQVIYSELPNSVERYCSVSEIANRNFGIP